MGDRQDPVDPPLPSSPPSSDDIVACVMALEAALLPCLPARELQAIDCSPHPSHQMIVLGRSILEGVTHNMLDDIHNHWKRAEAVRIKCLGVPTLDMDNVCFHLKDKSGGKIIYCHIFILLLYRGRNYDPKNRPVICTLEKMKLEASMHQGAKQQMPSFNLPSKILCKVVNVLLRGPFLIRSCNRRGNSKS